ncbi:iduronate sulfatase, partial [Lactobacillus parabuchneri]|nr:iduronate sulfatase [Lentilactobacillus parabuchneri]
TGWTVLGWCIALYMSLTSHRRLRPWGPRGL